MGAVAIFKGAYAKILASAGILFKNGLTLISGSANPSSVATSAAKGSLYMSDLGRLYQKQDAGSSTNWLSIDFTKAQEVVVAKSGGQYTAIQDAINAITDANFARIDQRIYLTCMKPAIIKMKSQLINYWILLMIWQILVYMLLLSLAAENPLSILVLNKP